MTGEEEAARHAESLDRCPACAHAGEPEGPRRIWLTDSAHLAAPENRPLAPRGHDEYGNHTIALRITPRRYLVIATTIPLRHASNPGNQ